MVRQTWMLFSLVAIVSIIGIDFQPVHAAIIAQDDFESYTEGATVIGENGGSGWTSAWAGNTPTNLPLTLATSGVIAGQGRSLELGTPGGDHRNIVLREFTPQTGDVYIGFTLQTGDWDGDFFQLYVNADNTTASSATTSSANESFSGGILNDPGMNRYFARKGSATAGVGTTVNSGSLQHTANVQHTLVLKLSKSLGGATDPYDEMSIWIDQLTEGTPDAFIDAASIGSVIGDTVSVLHVRMNVESTDRAYLDNLTVATTYASAVPEPDGVILGILGGALILRVGCRRRANLRSTVR